MRSRSCLLWSRSYIRDLRSQVVSWFQGSRRIYSKINKAESATRSCRIKLCDSIWEHHIRFHFLGVDWFESHNGRILGDRVTLGVSLSFIAVRGRAWQVHSIDRQVTQSGRGRTAGSIEPSTLPIVTGGGMVAPNCKYQVLVAWTGQYKISG